MPLPGFLFLASNIYTHAVAAAASAPIQVPLLGIMMPKMIFYIVGNVLTQYPFKKKKVVNT
jgi:UDP-xylose/UDP-N-acetylglucosamine transporter B4